MAMQSRRTLRFELAIGILAFIVLGANLSAQLSPDEIEFFEKKIRPVLAEKCYVCHGSKTEPMAGLRVDSKEALLKGGSRGTSIVSGDPDASILIQAIRYTDIKLKMPPSGKLPDEQIRDFEHWVRIGAPDPRSNSPGPAVTKIEAIDLEEGRKFWAFQPLRPDTHAGVKASVKRKGWATSPIDDYVLAKLEEKGLSPAPPADKRTLIRRVTFDLIGLPPTPQEIDNFLKDDSPGAFETLVERLLASPHYGERWGRHWLDLVRYAETNGHEYDNDKLDAWRYRDYVIRAFNNDRPYDQFTREHIAGDLLAAKRLREDGVHWDSPLGTGFYWFGEVLNSPTDSDKSRADTVDNQIDVLSKAFLGLTVACARCHDHKFDPIPTADYYSMAGILHSTAIREGWIGSPAQAEQVEKLDGRVAEVNRNIESLLAGAGLTPAETWKRYLLAAGELLSTNEIDLPCRLEELAEEQGLERLTLDRWMAYLRQAAKQPDHPLYAFAALAQPPDEAPPDDAPSDEADETVSASFSARLSEIRETLAELSRKTDPNHPENLKRGDVVFEDFSKQGYDGWTAEGRAFGSGPVRAIPPNQPLAGYAGESIANSFGGGTDRLVGSLTTPKFRMPKIYVHVRLAGNASDAPFPKNPDTRVTLDADGHKSQIFISRQPGVWQWVTRRMTKEIGRSCYFEIVDRSRVGHIAVDKIVFSDSREPPLLAPDPRVVELLGKPGLSSLSTLAGAYTELYENVSARSNSSAEARQLAAALRPPGSAEDSASPLLPAEQRDRLATLQYQRRTIADEIPESAFGMISKDENPRDVGIHLRGSHQNLGELAPRQFLQVIAGEDQAPYRNGSGRLQFAETLTSAGLPLAARVMVNRIWRHHFSTGIVASTDNFGKTGERPTHPELLDFLARQFVASGWSVKAMHRMMLLSSAYGMSSKAGQPASQLDPRNKLLHHMPVKRLEAEVIRDSVLAVSGSLNRDLFGPGVAPHISEYQDGRGKPPTGPLDGDGRRSIYLQVRRNFLTPMFLAFDYPSPISTIGRRGSSTVPSQALIMMNNEFVNQQARIWAERVAAEQLDAAGRIQGMFLAAFGRPASGAEVEEATTFLGEQRALRVGAGKDEVRPWADLAHVLMNSTEFIFVR